MEIGIHVCEWKGLYFDDYILLGQSEILLAACKIYEITDFWWAVLSVESPYGICAPENLIEV